MKQVGLSRKRRGLLGALSLSAAMPWLPASAARRVSAPARERLVLAGPPASVSNPLIHMVESGALNDLAAKVEFVQWANPDQLRALAMGGGADFIAAPTNVAANLYNRGVPLTLLNVSVWGILWMVSRNAGYRTLADFKGQEIALPFRADMPDIIFSFLAEKQGLDARRDFRLRYTSSPMDAVQLLAMRQVDHALLAEPAISMVLRKTRSFPVSLVAPDLYRSVNLQAEWGRLLHRDPRIPQAGMAALGPARNDGALVARFQAAYARSAQWCVDNAQECGAMVAARLGMLTPEAVADSLLSVPLHYVTAEQARPELEYFFQLLLQRQPATLGGKLPDPAFYGLSPAQA